MSRRIRGVGCGRRGRRRLGYWTLCWLVLGICGPIGRSDAQTPYTGGDNEFGVRFDLPQWTGGTHNRRDGFSNALTFTWDAKLVMYIDKGDPLWQNRPPGTSWYGFVFASFDPSAVGTTPDGRPDFGPCFGSPNPRFATISNINNTGPFNAYPEDPDGSGPLLGGYPDLAGTMGELGLLRAESLSNIMYPVPGDQLPVNAYEENPFRSDAAGTPALGGGYRTYLMYVTLQDQPAYWDPNWDNGPFLPNGAWRGRDLQTNGTATNLGHYKTRYHPGMYPNGVFRNPSWATPANGSILKRNGRAKLRVTVDESTGDVDTVEVLEKFKPFRVSTTSWPSVTVDPNLAPVSIPSVTEMWADNFEPSLTLDGHLMIGKGSSKLVLSGGGGSRVCFYYNDTPFGETGWQGPWELHHLYLHKDAVVNGLTLAERYPLARRPLKDYDGTVLGDGSDPTNPVMNGDLEPAEADLVPFEGGYNWISHDGRFVLYSCKTGGTHSGHPDTTNSDGGGTSNRAHVSIVGSVTGWQCWRIDHAAVNPSRHYYTGWDQESRTTHLRQASFGFSPGFWDLLREAPGVPLRDDGETKLQLVNSNRLLYYEFELAPYQERDYGFYLPMTEMMTLHDPQNPSFPVLHIRRDIDLTRTPDLSGNGHVASLNGAQLPCEYFELPSEVNSSGGVLGLHKPATNPSDIAPNWTSSHTRYVASGPNAGHWAKVADWKDGLPWTNPAWDPYAGRGDLHDMDSDTVWGRVGQAMFFRDETSISIDNAGQPPELNPGTSVPGASDELTISFWVHPLQKRSGTALLFQHHVTIELRDGGEVAASFRDAATGAVFWVVTPSEVVVDKKWSHIAVVWDGDTGDASIFVNGVEYHDDAFPGVALLGDSNADIDIGCLTYCGTQDGTAVLLLDEVALKNSAATAEEVARMALLPIASPPPWDNSNLPTAPLPFDNTTDGRVPASNPYDANIARLGADLFHDVQLSSTQDVSCGTCHQADKGFTDGLDRAIGVDPSAVLRNTPTILNQRFETRQFWDARAVDLEDQSLQPIFSAEEMGLDWLTVKAYLEGDPDYSADFAQYLQTAGSIEQIHVQRALATYMRSPTSGNSAADQFEVGAGTLPDAALRGRALFFGKAQCSGCHNGPNFTDGRLWTTGTHESNGDDDGAFEERATLTAGRAKFKGAFKTPSLRQLGLTGPYFHDGHADDLTAVVEFYNNGGVRPDGLGFPLLWEEHDIVAESLNRKLGLDATEIGWIVAYLNELNGVVDVGAVGFNDAPNVAVEVYDDGTITVDVIDPQGRPDLDTSMAYTLELVVDDLIFDWSMGTINLLPNGYQFKVGVTPGPKDVAARAADHHGKWSGYAYP